LPAYYFLMKSVNRSLEFLRRVSRRRSSTQRSVTSISEYIEQAAALLTPEDLDRLQTDLPLLNRQFAAIEAPQFPHLLQQLRLLAGFFKDTADGAFSAGSEASRKETAFALRYSVEKADIILDSIPEVGYADDSVIVRTVLSRHQDVLRDYCRFRKIRGPIVPLRLRPICRSLICAFQVLPQVSERRQPNRAQTCPSNSRRRR
jgi:uncharacterized membrane protein YkvA (DUF1232 family)